MTNRTKNPAKFDIAAYLNYPEFNPNDRQHSEELKNLLGMILAEEAKLSTGCRLLATIILHHTDHHCDGASPGNKALAQAMGITPRRVRDLMHILRQTGWIVRTESGSTARDPYQNDILSVRLPAPVAARKCGYFMERNLRAAGLVNDQAGTDA